MKTLLVAVALSGGVGYWIYRAEPRWADNMTEIGTVSASWGVIAVAMVFLGALVVMLVRK